MYLNGTVSSRSSSSSSSSSGCSSSSSDNSEGVVVDIVLVERKSWKSNGESGTSLCEVHDW